MVIGSANTQVVQAFAISQFDRLQRTRDDLNAQQKRLERPERYRIKYGRGVMRLEMYSPIKKAVKIS